MEVLQGEFGTSHELVLIDIVKRSVKRGAIGYTRGAKLKEVVQPPNTAALLALASSKYQRPGKAPVLRHGLSHHRP
jgi:hypothetical protein